MVVVAQMVHMCKRNISMILACSIIYCCDDEHLPLQSIKEPYSAWSFLIDSIKDKGAKFNSILLSDKILTTFSSTVFLIEPSQVSDLDILHYYFEIYLQGFPVLPFATVTIDRNFGQLQSCSLHDN